MKIVTFNIRSCYDSWDGINSFIHRAGLVREVIAEKKPDIIGFQEVIPQIKTLLEVLLPEYQILGHGRLEDFGGEGVFTAIRKETVELLGLDVSWMSDTPYVPASRYENQSQCPRTLNTAIVRYKPTGENFYVYNVHLDHIASSAQQDELNFMIDRMKADKQNKYDIPAVVMGDFNLKWGYSDAIKQFAEQKEFPLNKITGPYPATFHGFGTVDKDYEIDYIFVTDELKDKVQSVTMWEEEKNGIFLSDHYPICAEFDF